MRSECEAIGEKRLFHPGDLFLLLCGTHLPDRGIKRIIYLASDFIAIGLIPNPIGPTQNPGA
jgi:hypothetical protein